MNIRRREFIALVGCSAASARELLATYAPQALNQSEYALLDNLAETLLPHDDTGPGAHEARVAYYIDIVLKHSPSTRVEFWKNGLRGIETLARQRFQQSLAACSEQQRQEVMSELAKNELEPETELDHFFLEFKRLAIDAFYASELVQHDHLGYRGNTAIAEFAGCPHTNFDHPGI